VADAEEPDHGSYRGRRNDHPDGSSILSDL
jgi:hypothetical protein